MQRPSFRSLLMAALLAGAMSLAQAQQSNSAAPPQGQGEGGAPLPNVAQATAEALNTAIGHMDAGEYALAKEVIGELDREKLSPYELGRVEQILATIAVEEGDYGTARTHFTNALNSGGLAANEILNLKFQIAQLYLGDEMYQEAADAFEEWFTLATDPNPVAYFFLAVCYYELGDNGKALTNARLAVESTNEPQEQWLSLLIALLIDSEDYEEARDQLVRVLELAPQKKNYWLQLSQVNTLLDDNERALAAVEIPYLAGMLDQGTDVRRYADLLLYNRIGYRCGTVLEKAVADGLIEANLSTYQKLADCWLQSGELEKAAAALGQSSPLADTGKDYVRLGEVEIRRERYDAAERAFQSALNKGGLDDVPRVQLLMGVVIYNGDNPCSSREWFERARSSTTHRQNAIGYLQLLDIEGCR
jgi:tetratricopeptide (TPR) repeat protein